MPPWSAATRPPIRLAKDGARCPQCGRGVYVSERGVFLRCLGCDETPDAYWCPELPPELPRVTA